MVIEGSIIVNGEQKVPTDHFVLFQNEGETFSIEAAEDALILIISGQPLNETYLSARPFCDEYKRGNYAGI